MPLHLSDNIKVQYLQFMSYMKTPQYRSNLQQLLEEEKVSSAPRCSTDHHRWRSIQAAFCPSGVVWQQKHRDLSGQAEQLHLVCQSHKDKIKSLFQTKLDEV